MALEQHRRSWKILGNAGTLGSTDLWNDARLRGLFKTSWSFGLDANELHSMYAGDTFECTDAFVQSLACQPGDTWSVGCQLDAGKAVCRLLVMDNTETGVMATLTSNVLADVSLPRNFAAGLASGLPSGAELLKVLKV